MMQVNHATNMQSSKHIKTVEIGSQTRYDENEEIDMKKPIHCNEEINNLEICDSIINEEISSKDDDLCDLEETKEKAKYPSNKKNKNAITQTGPQSSPKIFQSAINERIGSPFRRKSKRIPSGRFRESQILSEKSIDENSVEHWARLETTTDSDEENEKVGIPKNCWESVSRIDRPVVGVGSLLRQHTETVRRIPSDTLTAFHAALMHSSIEELEGEGTMLLPLQAEASFDDNWVMDSVSSILKSSATACFLSESIEERVASTSGLSMSGTSLCRLLPPGNVRPCLKRTESWSNSTSDAESMSSDASDASDTSLLQDSVDTRPVALPSPIPSEDS